MSLLSCNVFAFLYGTSVEYTFSWKLFFLQIKNDFFQDIEQSTLIVGKNNVTFLWNFDMSALIKS